MSTHTFPAPEKHLAGRVRLEISAEHLARLLESQQLCAADFRCLDGESRYCVRALCQRNCSRYLAGLGPAASCGTKRQNPERPDGAGGKSLSARKGGHMSCDGGCMGCQNVSDGVYLTPFFLHRQVKEDR